MSGHTNDPTSTNHTKDADKGQRTIASVNREISMLRRMLNIAQREGWIFRSPVAADDSLISLADENKRERILTREAWREELEGQ